MKFLLFFRCVPLIMMMWNLFFSAELKAAPEPTVPASGLTANVVNCNEIDLSWISGDGSRRLVIASAEAPVSAFPVDAVSYIAGNIFGTGSNLGNNNYVVYNSNGSNVTVTGLNASKYYYFTVIEYNGSGVGTNYLISGYPELDTIPFGLVLTLSASDTVLCSGTSVTLEASGAATYSWTPATGLSATTGAMVTASPSATTRYSVLGTDSLGCQAIERITLTVIASPNVTLGQFSAACQDDAPRTLTGGSPSGGVYSGPGVSGGQFDPSVAGPGIHTITYTYTNPQGCSKSAFSNITVHARPAVSIGAFNNRCENGGILTLSSGNPSGGMYSGTGVSGTQFDPAVAMAGVHTISYTYTDSQGCTNTASSNITVLAVPNAMLTLPATLCIDDNILVLTGGSPGGGNYSGPGVIFGTFNPSAAGVGVHTIAYRYTNSQGCSDTAFAAIEVLALPQVTLSTFNPVCLNTPSFTLTGGSPAGGIYDGNGISNNIFSASVGGVGRHLITYTYADSFGCVSTDTAGIVVNPLPTVSFSALNPVCSNTGPVALSGGLPAGGTYSGTGVGGGIFFSGIAGAGSHTITYTYSDTNNCINTATQTMVVHPVPIVSLGPDTMACADASVVLDPGPGYSSYSWSTGQNTQSIVVDSTGRGLGTFSIRLIVTNSFGCVGRDTLLISFDICSGLPDPGASLFASEIFPNPFSDHFSVELLEEANIRIYDLQGRLQEQFQAAGGKVTMGKELVSGVYLVQLSGKRNSRSAIIVKQ